MPFGANPVCGVCDPDLWTSAVVPFGPEADSLHGRNMLLAAPAVGAPHVLGANARGCRNEVPKGCSDMTTNLGPVNGAAPDEVRPPPISPFDAAVLKHLTEHLADEAEILDEYRLLAASPDAPVRYLAQLILEDEERHHRVMTELANQFRSSVSLVEHPPQVPWLTSTTDRQGLAHSVRRLHRFERRDLRQLRKLARHLRPIRNDSLDPVIVATLEMDTRKHLRYLRELHRIARRQ